MFPHFNFPRSGGNKSVQINVSSGLFSSLKVLASIINHVLLLMTARWKKKIPLSEWDSIGFLVAARPKIFQRYFIIRIFFCRYYFFLFFFVVFILEKDLNNISKSDYYNIPANIIMIESRIQITQVGRTWRRYAGYCSSLASSEAEREVKEGCSLKSNHLLSLFLLKISEYYTINL